MHIRTPETIYYFYFGKDEFLPSYTIIENLSSVSIEPTDISVTNSLYDIYFANILQININILKSTEKT